VCMQNQNVLTRMRGSHECCRCLLEETCHPAGPAGHSAPIPPWWAGLLGACADDETSTTSSANGGSSSGGALSTLPGGTGDVDGVSGGNASEVSEAGGWGPVPLGPGYLEPLTVVNGVGIGRIAQDFGKSTEKTFMYDQDHAGIAG
jgi:hypothetical protein